MRTIKNSMYVLLLLRSAHITSQIVADHFSTRWRIRLWSLHRPITGRGRYRVLSYQCWGSASASRTEQRTGFGLVVRVQGWLWRTENVIIPIFHISYILNFFRFLATSIPGIHALSYEGFAGTEVRTVNLPPPPPGAPGGNWGATWNLWTPVKVSRSQYA